MPKRALMLLGAATLCLTALTIPARAATTVNVPDTIAADCSVDVTADLTTFLQSVPNSSIVEFPAGGCYRIETYVQVTGKSSWTLEGNGSTLERTQTTPTALQYPKANPFLWLTNPTRVTIDSLHIEGTNTTGVYNTTVPFDAGIRLDNPSTVTVKNTTTDATYGDGIQINGAASHVTLTADTITLDGRQGISFVNGSYYTINRVTIDRSARAGIDMEPNTSANTISNVLIENSTIGSHLLAFSSGGPGAVNGITITNNTVTKSGVPVVYDIATNGARRDTWTVKNNTFQPLLGSPYAAMRFANTGHVHVTGNSLRLATTQSRLAVEVRAGTNSAYINCNWFQGGGDPYIKSDAASSYTATNNTTGSTAPTGC